MSWVSHFSWFLHCVSYQLISIPWNKKNTYFIFYWLLKLSTFLHPFSAIQYRFSHFLLSIISSSFTPLDSSLHFTYPILHILSSSTQWECKNPVSLKRWHPLTLDASKVTQDKWMEIYIKTVCTCTCMWMSIWVGLYTKKTRFFWIRKKNIQTQHLVMSWTVTKWLSAVMSA